MKGCVALLVLLFCLSEAAGAPGESGAVNERQSDAEPGSLFTHEIWDVMIELRDMVVVQQEKMRDMEEQMTVMAAKLSASESHVKDLQVHVADRQTRLNTSDVQVEDLKEESEDKPKVAFSVGLGSGTFGPYGSVTTLVYKRVNTNVGNAYNPSTGLFSAPVKGLYHFTYAAFNRWSSELFCVYMFKNDQQLLGNCGTNSGGWEQISNGMMVELEEGDTVDMRLEIGSRLYDNSDNHDVFNGVLLYSM